MALTGLDIFKSLPKTNCKECGVPTCLAFAMKVASGQAGLDDCPQLTDEARASLTEASAPPAESGDHRCRTAPHRDRPGDGLVSPR